MISPTRRASRVSSGDDRSPGGNGSAPSAGNPYGRAFWMAYLANTAAMTALALLFRYADFVTVLGGTEWHLGWIVGMGTVGSLAMRLSLGRAIDRYGPRLVWTSSLVILAGSCFAHLAVTTHNGPGVYCLRIVYCSAIAGVFGAAMTFISGRAPIVRMAEMIGMLGTSGFLGILAGTQLGDLLLGTATIHRWQVDQMFLVSGVLALLAIGFALGATRDEPRPAPRRRQPLVGLLRRYQPGMVLLVGAAMGIGIGLPSTFLRTYAAELDIPRIGLFFGTYAPAAILTRLFTRRLPERIGLPPMILAGLGLLVAGQLLLLVVEAEWMFIVPAVGYGMGHAVLVPSVVAAGSTAFPNRYRGLGTTLMLATFDLGMLLGAPAAGAILHYSKAVGLPSYPTLFVSAATLLSFVGILYAVSRRAPRQPFAGKPAARRLAARDSAAHAPAARDPAAQSEDPPLVETGSP